MTINLYMAWICLTVVVGGCAAAEPVGTDQKISDIFVPAMDVSDALPELIAQLQIPAVINLGELKDYPKFRRIRDDLPAEPLPPSKEMRSEVFEFKGGTVREALDAFCRSNRSVSWEHRNGVFYLNRAHQNDVLKASVAYNIRRFHLDNKPFADFESDFQNTMGSVLYATSKGSVELVYQGASTESGIHDFFPPRENYPGRISMDLAEVRCDEVLGAVARSYPNHMGIVAYSEDKSSKTMVVALTNWNTASRGRSINELADDLSPQNNDRGTYRSVAARMGDACREIRRQHHFQPSAVGRKLRESEGLKKLLAIPPYPHDASDASVSTGSAAIQALFELGEDDLSRTIMTEVVARRDVDARPGGAGVDVREQLIRTFPRPPHAGFAVAKPVWEKLRESDPDPAVRSLAQSIMDWHVERAKVLKLPE